MTTSTLPPSESSAALPFEASLETPCSCTRTITCTGCDALNARERAEAALARNPHGMEGA